MDSNKTITIQALPVYIVALFEYLTHALPTLILWISFLYGAIQLFLLVKQLTKDTKEKDDKIIAAKKNESSN